MKTGSRIMRANPRSEFRILYTGIALAVLLTPPAFGQGMEYATGAPDFLSDRIAANVAGGQRPSFLPAPEYDAVEEAPSAEPETMIAQIELPVPRPVSQSPMEERASERDVEEDEATLIAQTSSGPSIIFEKDQRGLQTPPPPPPAAPDPGILLREKRYTELEPIVTNTQDAKLAAALAWSYYNDRKYPRASHWFQQSLKWDDSDSEAAYGLALVLLRQGQYDKAEEVARWRAGDYPQMKNILGDVATAKAVSAYKAKNYSRSRQLFEEVREYRPLTRDERVVLAWNDFNSGNVRGAREQFETLYIERRDKYAAGGVYAAYAREKEWEALGTFSRQHGGPILEMYQVHVAQRYYDRGLYRRAYSAAPEKYPELRNFTAPSVTAAGKVRFKSGASGRSKLREIRGDAAGVIYQNDFSRLSARIGLTSLSAGSLPNRKLVGSAPLDGDRDYRHSTKTRYDSLVDLRLRYDYQGTEYSPYVELGISPAGGAESPTIVGMAGIRGDHEWGSWTGEIFRESVKESILSYTGMIDPFTGDSWGRVAETGLRLTLSLPLEDQWSVYGEFLASVLEGQNVESNTHVKFTLAFNRSIPHSAFTYLTVGPAFTFEHYSENLSHFTIGHGGYFSPDYLFQGTIGAHFLTLQGKPWLLKGDFDLGLQSYSQGTTPVFPLDDDVSVYGQEEDQTFVAAVSVAGLVQLSSKWMLQAHVGYNRTADYSEFIGGLSFTYYFSPRQGLFLSDFKPY